MASEAMVISAPTDERLLTRCVSYLQHESHLMFVVMCAYKPKFRERKTADPHDPRLASSNRSIKRSLVGFLNRTHFN